MYCVTAPSTPNPIVIIGGGLAGGNAAATLREEGFPGPVVLISAEPGEPGVPFGRPPLSKTYLRSEEDLDGWYVRPAGWYADHDVELRRGTVAAVDPAAHTLTLDSGEELGYSRALIATGGRNRKLTVPEPACPGSATCARRPSATRSSGRRYRAGTRSWWARGSSAARSRPR